MTSSKEILHKIVYLVIVYLHTKFYGNWASFTEVMEGGHFEPPPVLRSPKKPSSNRVNAKLLLVSVVKIYSVIKLLLFVHNVTSFVNNLGIKKFKPSISFDI